jgi:Cu/Ag efflux protein CusF
MKKVAAVAAVAILVVSLASLVFAADAKKGTIKSVDAKAGTIVLTIDGKDETLKADKSVDLGKVKAGDKVEATVEKDTVMTLKTAAKPKAAVGC